MSDNSRTVSGSVTLKERSETAIAFELMRHIGEWEAEVEEQDRKYWLTLFCQCKRATDGYGVERVLDRTGRA